MSLPEIQKLTGWQKHTVRGFISVLGSKAGLKIISTRNEAGERTYRVAGSYVTGTHTFKTGWNDTFGYLDTYNYAYQPMSYTFLNGAPTSLTEYATPFTSISNENHDLGAFAQDTVRLNRATVIGALRYDWFKTGFPAQTVGAGSPLVACVQLVPPFVERKRPMLVPASAMDLSALLGSMSSAFL